MTGNRYHASTDPVSLLADAVVEPDRDLLGSLDAGVDARPGGNGDFVVDPGPCADVAFAVDAELDGAAGPDAGPVVAPSDVTRVQVRALSARIGHLESQLERAERRRLATIDRYEYLLERRTETFRSWVAEDDPRPAEFEWIGREVDASDRFEGPSPDAGTATAVATDGGRVRRGSTDERGIVGRLLGRIRSALSR